MTGTYKWPDRIDDTEFLNRAMAEWQSENESESGYLELNVIDRTWVLRRAQELKTLEVTKV
jgi:hypothetical protein